jgi:hypothetical protein
MVSKNFLHGFCNELPEERTSYPRLSAVTIVRADHRKRVIAPGFLANLFDNPVASLLEVRAQ